MGAAVVVVVDKWTEKAPSTFPQLFFCTLRNRWDNLKEITEKSLHYPFANQNWSTRIDYLVEHITQKQWCAYTNGVIRYCVINLHSSPVTVMAKSEAVY
jgi:hypothetical protein